MIQSPAQHCNCCGLPVNPLVMQDCPRCNYPVNPGKEERFLESAIHDLQRVAHYGGANMRVVDLIHRYQSRLDTLSQLKQMVAPNVPVAHPLLEPTATIQSVPAVPEQAEMLPGPVIPPLSPQEAPVTVPPAQVSQRTRSSVFSWSSFFADQVINIVASLGAFLLLIGALSFTITTSSLILSFLVIFAVHAVFGITGFVTYRFPTFRIVANIYTVIFALLVPLVGFSAYRLVSGSHIEFSIPVLIAISAAYAAIMYTVLAIYQRFIPFAYLAMVALVVADLAVANTLNLAYWWWPCMLMLLAIAALISIRRPTGSAWPFTAHSLVLRDPIRFVMYAIVAASILSLLYTASISMLIDINGMPNREVRFSILSLTVLLLLWASLSLFLARRTRTVIVLAYIALLSVLALCYAFAFEPIGYTLALTCLALLYHGLTRFAGRLLRPFGMLSLGLDQIALVLVFLVPFISSPLVPLQLFARTYTPPPGIASFLQFQTNWRTVAELIATGLGIILTVSVAFSRAGVGKTSFKAAWCWLLLLGGFLLNWEYAIVVLALNIAPAWSFLGLTLLTVASTAVTRRLFGAAWANPLDVLALIDITFTLSLSLNQSQNVISALLLFFAILLYIMLLFQRRQNWLFLPLIFVLLALPTLWDRPIAVLLLAISLPLVSVAIHKLISNRWNVSLQALFKVC